MLELADQLRPEGLGRAPSFRSIAVKQLGASVGASSLWRAAAIYRLAQRYPELESYRHVGVGHLSVLLSLRGPVQLALLRLAERRRWSRRKLEAMVKRISDARSIGADPLGSLLGALDDREREGLTLEPGS